MNRARKIIARIARVSCVALLVLTWCLTTAWCAMAAWYAPNGPSWLRLVIAVLIVAFAAYCAFLQRRRWLRFVGPLAIWSVVIARFWFIPASNERAWQPDVAVTPHIEIVGDRMTVFGVRDFTYRSEADYDQHWEDRTYDLSKLRTLDLFMSYWGPTLICHTFVSFGFERADASSDAPYDYLCISIEARKQVGESYNAVASAFRQFELVFIWADERDVVRLRTNFRHEDVYRYQIVADANGVRRLLDAYVARTNQLAQHAEWYNAITESCGVSIVRLAKSNQLPLFPPVSALLNGLWDQRAYDDGMLDRRVPFGTLRQMAHINDLAVSAPLGEFSKRIRTREVRATPKVDLDAIKVK